MNSSEPRARAVRLAASRSAGSEWPSGRGPAALARIRREWRGGRSALAAALVTWLIPASRPWLLFGKSCALARCSGDTGFRMLDDPFKYGLLAALAIALLVAAFTDLRSRQIDNWLNARDRARPRRCSGGPAASRCGPTSPCSSASRSAPSPCSPGCSRCGAMGGGDVKLLTALALWIAPTLFLKLLIVMALLGGVLTLVFGAWHVAAPPARQAGDPLRRRDRDGRAVGARHQLPARQRRRRRLGVNPILTTSALSGRNHSARIQLRGLDAPWTGRSWFCCWAR